MKRSEIEMDLNNLKKIKNWGNKNYIVNIKRRYKTMRKSREFGLFKDVPDELWNDWHWQVKNRVETVEDLKNT